MEWGVIILFLILLALASISSQLGRLIQAIINKREVQPQPADLSGLEDILEKIYKIMGGVEKMKTRTDKDRKELKEKYIKLIISGGHKTEKEAKTEADKYFEDAEFEETHDSYAGKFKQLEMWVINREIEERNKAKYSALLDAARQYIKGKTKIEMYHNDMEKVLKTDYNGQSWLIKQLISEKKLKEITKWDPEIEMSTTTGWEVINS